ncbi:uncharacterized protein C2orf81 homolog isoform X2 [Stegostoma tigrinum]|uniref:uncharacterized protein C2orf81 homolog isoform X2 n=1 Tax=Stegostoma tigrinum TaxID=3053191 RepID=UPI00202B1017|nr:uncharacterized protein C2orf81 homolog isoform X2 [Stegostoma tigrinum]
MSRSAAQRSRLEKGRTISAAVSTPASVVEIIPGRFTENDWLSMVNIEDTESQIGDIIDDIVNQVLDGCYRVYIEKQLLPFTITQAKDAILQIIEWQFLTYDPGERNVALDPSWQEDDEPIAYITDSWAQGSVPVETYEKTTRHTTCLIMADRGPPDDEFFGHDPRPECGSSQQEQDGGQPQLSICKELMGYHLQSEKKPDKVIEAVKPEESVISDEPQTLPKVPKKRQKYKPHQGALNSAKLKDITKPLAVTEQELFQQYHSPPCIEEPPPPPCEIYRMTSYFQNVLKIQNSRLPLNNSVTFDQFGNVTSVQRLKPSQFPRKQLRPIFQLLDVDLELETHRPFMREALRPLVFRSGNFGKKFIPVRYKMRRILQKIPGNEEEPRTLGQVVGGKVNLQGSNSNRLIGRPATAQQLRLREPCVISTSPEFIEFIPDGAKDRNCSNYGQNPEYDEEQFSRLRPICNSLVKPPVLVEQLSRSIIQ